ncbi:uncharacterized protein LOC143683316 [Tamandua tetradactyla]|uniref:uncharacterized protein LOC143683316 n=1 Tax=Tamandua tetradactyla TaxID=48850 RepID=UPI004053FF78
MRRGFGPARRASECRAPALPRPQLGSRPARPPPPGPVRPGPRRGKGRPLTPAAEEGSPSAAAEPDNLRGWKSFWRLGGAVQRGSPLASAVTAGDFLVSSSAGPAPRPPGTAGWAGVRPRASAPRAKALESCTRRGKRKEDSNNAGDALDTMEATKGQCSETKHKRDI